MKKILLALFLFFFSLNISAQVNVIIPDIVQSNLSIGDEVSVMLTSSDLSGLGVISFQFTLNYDETVVTATGINTSGTISGADGWTVLPNTDTPGQISVAGFGASELTGEGDFIEIIFEVASEPGYTDLTTDDFLFNAGSPEANVTNGSITINTVSTVDIVIPDVLVGGGKSIGDEVSVMLTSSDLSGLGVISFQFTLNYDASVVTATGINTSGTISGADGWTVLPNTDTPGQISVAGFGASELTGEGDFIEIIFEVASEPGYTDLTTDDFLFNAGSPEANVTNGSITINICGEVDIAIPDLDATSANIGDELFVIINSSDLTGLGALSFDFTVTYNPGLITATGISTDGTITGADGWTVTGDTDTPGQISVSGYGTNELTGSGDFITLIFTKDYDYGVSDLIVTNWLFNDGCPTVQITNGSIILPVELTSFMSQIEDNDVKLTWETATETNNKGFELFRNNERIDFIAGYGTTTETKTYQYEDKELPNGLYTYRLVQVDYDGSKTDVGEIEVKMEYVPKEFTLYQNYPNPFSKGSGGNPSTTIKFDLPKAVRVKLAIYNVVGEEVSVLVDNEMAEGAHKVTFSAVNLPSGIYYYRIIAGDFVSVKKMLLLK